MYDVQAYDAGATAGGAGAGGKAGGAGGGGGMGSMLSQLGNVDLTFGQGKEFSQRVKSEQSLLETLLKHTPHGMQVTSGQTPAAAPVNPWLPFLIQNLLSFNPQGARR